MYLQFYQLKKAPFKPSADPDVLWAGKNYQKSLEALRYGLTHHSGLSLFTGNPGSGKTTVIHAVLRSLEQTVLAAVIPDSSLTVQEFYDLVAHSFALSGQLDNRLSFHEHILSLLQQAAKQKKQVLLVVDEAQQLSAELIEEIDALVNLHPEESGGLNICLIGQVDKASGLGRHVTQAFENHVMVRYHLGPFTAEETEGYIRLRLQVAGADREIFNEGALQAVHRYSEGYPGQINIICDLALFSGFAEKSPEINAQLIRACAEKLQFPTVGGKKDALKSEPPVTPITSTPRSKWSKLGDAQKEEKEGEVSPTAGTMAVPESGKGSEAQLTKTTKRSFVIPTVSLLVILTVAGGGYVFYTQRGDGGVSVDTPVTPTPVVQATSADPPTPLESSSVHEQTEHHASDASDRAQVTASNEQPVESPTVGNHESEKAVVPVIKKDTLDIKGDERENLTVEQPVHKGRLEVKELLVEENVSSAIAVEAPPIKPEKRKSAVTESANSLEQPVNDEPVKAFTLPESNAAQSAAIEEQVVQATTLAEEQIAQSGDVAIARKRINDSQEEHIISIPPAIIQDKTAANQPMADEGQQVAASSVLADLPMTDSTDLDSVPGVGKGTEGAEGGESKLTDSVPAGGRESESVTNTFAVKDEQEAVESTLPAATLTKAGAPEAVLEAGSLQEGVVVVEPSLTESFSSSSQDSSGIADTKVMHDEQQSTSVAVPVQPRKAKLQEFLGGGSFVEPAVSASAKREKQQTRIQPVGSIVQQEKVDIRPEIEPAPDPSDAIDWVLKQRDKQNLSAP